jgi:hypothetical protein
VSDLPVMGPIMGSKPNRLIPDLRKVRQSRVCAFSHAVAECQVELHQVRLSYKGGANPKSNSMDFLCFVEKYNQINSFLFGCTKLCYFQTAIFLYEILTRHIARGI